MGLGTTTSRTSASCVAMCPCRGAQPCAIIFLNLFKNANGSAPIGGNRRTRQCSLWRRVRPYPAMRLAARARCEFYLLRAMPVLPLAFWMTADLIKPFVRDSGIVCWIASSSSTFGSIPIGDRHDLAANIPLPGSAGYGSSRQS
jgi:hypothetical protein